MSASVLISTLLASLPMVSLSSSVEEQLQSVNPNRPAISRFRQTADSLLRHNPDSAFAFSLSRLMTSVNNADTLSEAYSRYQLGRCYFEIGQYQLASDSYRQAMEMFSAIDDGNGQALVWRSLGYLRYNMGDAKGALEYYLSAAKLIEKIEDPNDKSELYNRLGVVYARLSIPLESKGYFDKALLLDEYRNDSTAISRTLNNLGFSFNLLSQPGDALSYLKESLSIKQKARLGEAAICPTLHNIAESFFLLGRPDSAIVYSKRCLEIAERMGLLQRKKESAELQTKIYTSLGDFKQAFIAQELFYKTTGDIFGQNNELLIKTMVDQHKRELQEKETVISGITARRANFFSHLGVGLIGSVLLSLLAWLVRARVPGLFGATSLLTLVLTTVWLAQYAIGVFGENGVSAAWLSFLCLLSSAILVIGLKVSFDRRLKK